MFLIFIIYNLLVFINISAVFYWLGFEHWVMLGMSFTALFLLNRTRISKGD